MKRTMLSIMTLLVAAVLVLTGCAEVEEGIHIPQADSGASAPQDAYFPAHFINVGYVDSEACAAIFGDQTGAQLNNKLPILKIDSREALEVFRSTAGQYHTLDVARDDLPSFTQKIDEYDDAFFEKNLLFVSYVYGTSSPSRFAVNDLSVTSGRLTVEICQVSDGLDQAMEGWFLLLEMDREIVANVSEFAAYMGSDRTDDSKQVTIRRTDDSASQFFLLTGNAAESLEKLLSDLPYAEESVTNDPEEYTIAFASGNKTYTLSIANRFVRFDGGQAKLDSTIQYQFRNLLIAAGQIDDPVKPETYSVDVGWSPEGEEELLKFAEPTASGMLPMVRLDSKEELDAMVAATTSYFFCDLLLERYDAAYFDTKSLLVVYVEEGSGSIQHVVTGFEANGQTLEMEIMRFHATDSLTMDMAGWFMIAEIDRAILESYTEYGATTYNEDRLFNINFFG